MNERSAVASCCTWS